MRTANLHSNPVLYTIGTERLCTGYWPIFIWSPILYTQPCVVCNRFIIRQWLGTGLPCTQSVQLHALHTGLALSPTHSTTVHSRIHPRMPVSWCVQH